MQGYPLNSMKLTLCEVVRKVSAPDQNDFIPKRDEGAWIRRTMAVPADTQPNFITALPPMNGIMGYPATAGSLSELG